ncbi:MAG: hypothetical protein ACOC3W_10585 [Thermodesulfobacteriota bacterium]
MRLSIDHQCPQCGAPAVLEETDRLFHCEYCRVKSYLLQRGCFRYMLPHQAPSGARLIYAPYWRMRGMLFGCLEDGVRHRVVDHSRQAVAAPFLPRTLGLRSQAMRLAFAGGDEETRFLAPTVTRQGAVDLFEERYGAAFPSPPYEQAFIGETLSMIYAPFYLADGLVDAVLNRRVQADEPDLAGFKTEPPRWPILFVPTLCPNCGWDMEADRDALALPCRRCNSLWRAGSDRLVRMKAAFLPAAETGAVYLPFWRIRADVSGLLLDSVADLVRLANLPRAVQPGWESRPFYFWVPAFKLPPRVFLQIGCFFTGIQSAEAPENGLPEGPGDLYPVKLPVTEAVECLKLMLADFLKPRRTFLPRIPRMEVTPRQALLVYLPFRNGPHDLTHPRHPVGINKNMLRLGQGI